MSKDFCVGATVRLPRPEAPKSAGTATIATIQDKETACGCAGIFNSAYHMQFLATFFKEHDMADRLEDFCTRFGADYYRVPRNSQQINLVPAKLMVPEKYGQFVPFAAGRELAYDLVWD